MMLEKDPTTGRYVMRIDASLYKDSNCMRYVYFKLIRGYSGTSDMPSKSPSMEYGTAFHKGLQARAEGKPLDVQLKIVTDHFGQPDIVVQDTEWRNIGHLVNTYIAYDTYYKTNGDLLVPQQAEFKFGYPLYKTDKTEVLLLGTIDLSAKFCGRPVIVDHKTTSSWNIVDYLAEYDLSPQLMIYKWVYDTFHNTDVGCMINGIFISKAKPAQFKRSEIISFSHEQISMFITSLTKFAANLAQRFEHDTALGDSSVFAPNYNCCVKRYGEKAIQCPYAMICKQATLADGLALADQVYAKKVYDPAQFQV